MNIHVLINCYYGEGISGGDRRVLELLRRWQGSEHNLIIYTSANFARLMQNEGIKDTKLVLTDGTCKKSDGIIKTYAKRTRKTVHALKQNCVSGDVIYSPTDILPDIYPAMVVKKKRYDISWKAITFHIFEKFYKRPGNIVKNFLSCMQQKYAINLINKYADKYLTTSPLVCDYLEKTSCNMSKVILVDNAVDVDLVESANLQLEGFDAVFLARLNYSKGIFELPVIWKRVTERLGDKKLALIGAGSEEIVKELRDTIDRMGLSNSISMLGYLEAEQAYSIMKNSEIFLFTSHEEGWGMAIAEAMVCKLPVVAYDLPIFKHLFPQGIITCELKNTDMMADAVIQLLEDENKRVTMGNEGHEYVCSHYSLQQMSEKELEIIIS